MVIPNVFLCDAVYHGSRDISGALTPSKLSSLADAFFYPDEASYKTSNLDKLAKGDKCQLQIDEERLKVNCSRKDEGFESDSDTSSTHGSVERVRESQEVKVIKDHVLRLEKLIRQDSGICRGFSPSLSERAVSLSSSSGAESEEETLLVNNSSEAMKGNLSMMKQNVLKISSSFEESSGSLNSFWISDILFCHVISHRPKVVIIVIKSQLTSVTTAHVFECVTSEAARTLYSSYSVANNKYKLDRYRNSRRMNDEKFSSHVIPIKNTREKLFDEGNLTKPQFLKENSTQFGDLPGDSSFNLRNQAVSDESANSINVIQIKEGCTNFPYAMMQRIDSNGVTHIEIDSSSRGFPSLPLSQNNQNVANTRDAISALERLSFNSSSNPDSYLNYSGVTGSCPNSLIVTSREIAAKNVERNKKLRQCYPPIILRNGGFGHRNDSMPATEIKRSNERRNRSKSEERKGKLFNISFEDDHITHSLSHTSSPRMSRKGQFNNDDDLKYSERQPRSRSVTRNKDTNDRARSRNGKRHAPPPPPPRRHPDNPSLLLVPTKTGQEASKSYYPKETHNIRGNKIVRIDYPLYPPWNMNSDINNNPARVYYAPPSWTGYHEYHTSRSSDHNFTEMRKRSRSKSPARKPMAHRYIDVVSTLNISQRLREFSDSVINSIKSNNSSINGFSKEELQRHGIRKSKKSYEVFNTETALKSVIKSGKKDEPVGEVRRVTFNSYATVQVMD